MFFEPKIYSDMSKGTVEVICGSYVFQENSGTYKKIKTTEDC